MNNVAFSITKYGSSQYLEAVKLREEILRKPLGLTFSSEELASEQDHIMIIGLVENIVVATCSLIIEGEIYKIQRVAVRKYLQNKNIGSKMLLFCEEYVRTRKCKLIYCHARNSAVNFYTKNGYKIQGEYFDEDNIPHIKMWKKITS